MDKEQFEVTEARFRQDLYTKIFFADNDQNAQWDPGKLFVRSEWQPPVNKIPIAIRARVSDFLRRVKPHFTRKKRSPPNLTKFQRRLLQFLRTNDDFIVIPTNKNLGLAILERNQYIRRAFLDHLMDQNTYLQLTKTEVVAQVEPFITAHSASINDDDRTYLRRKMVTKDPLSHFYIIAKVHKDPWKTRPIVLYSGTLCEGLGKWLDKQLKPLAHNLPSYLKRSFEFKKLCDAFIFLPDRRY
jgi:hypothetical protein